MVVATTVNNQVFSEFLSYRGTVEEILDRTASDDNLSLADMPREIQDQFVSLIDTICEIKALFERAKLSKGA